MNSYLVFMPRIGGGGGENLTKKEWKSLLEILKRILQEVPRPCFEGVAWNLFSPLRGTK